MTELCQEPCCREKRGESPYESAEDAAARLAKEILDSIKAFLPCPVTSSLTERPCELKWGHMPFSPQRTHKFRPSI